MGGPGTGPPSRLCSRCEKFEVREDGISLCLVCRRTYQLGTTVLQVFPKEAESYALKFLDKAFGWLEDTLKEAQDIERAKGSGSAPPNPPSVVPSAAAEAPLKRKIVDSPPARSKPTEETARIKNCPSALESKPKPSETSRPSSSSRGVPTVPSRVPTPPKAPPILTPAKAKGSVALVENSQVPAVTQRRDQVSRHNPCGWPASPSLSHRGDNRLQRLRLRRWRLTRQRRAIRRRKGRAAAHLPVRGAREGGEKIERKKRKSGSESNRVRAGVHR